MSAQSLEYMTDSYKRESSARVVEISTTGTTTTIVLDRTIFYAQGGGQPADVGLIQGKNGALQVTHVSYNGGRPKHIGTMTGNLQVGDDVVLKLDWLQRYRHMQMHTAGHVLDQAVKNVIPSAKPTDGMHGIGKKMLCGIRHFYSV
jgi:Ser-tRNA(Ala) deacylase AlaX